MKSTDLGKCYDLAQFRRFNGSRFWCILVQRQVRSAIVIGRTRVKLGRVFRLEDIAEAHRAMEDNTAGGKLVVVTS